MAAFVAAVPSAVAWIAVAWVAAAWVATGCASPPEAADPGERPDILLISVDTLRADRLGTYGYERPTSPFIDRLATEGIRFERAYSTSSWTVPAVVSMLTSSYPRRHGMGERAQRDEGQWHVIPADLPSLPEALRDAGYRTYGFTANFGLPAERGFSRGFDRYRCIGAQDLAAVHRELERWLPDFRNAEPEGEPDSGPQSEAQSEPQSEPWFLWLHLFDPHAPYDARQPWLRELHPESAEASTEAAPNESSSVSASTVTDPARDPAVIERAARHYDSEVRDLDDYLRRLFELVPRFERAVIAFTADHGEEFLDHGGVLHGSTLFDESARVPLIVRFPDRRLAGKVVEDPVSLVDILPTLLSAAGVEIPAGTAGVSLVDGSGLAVPERRAVFAELEGTEGLSAAMAGGWKLVLGNQAAKSGLFDLSTDPGETTDLSTARPEIAARFRERLADYAKEHAAPDAPLAETEITEDQAEALRTLGYIQ